MQKLKKENQQVWGVRQRLGYFGEKKFHERQIFTRGQKEIVLLFQDQDEFSQVVVCCSFQGG